MAAKPAGWLFFALTAALYNTSFVSAQSEIICAIENLGAANLWYATATDANLSAAEVVNLANQKDLVDAAISELLNNPDTSACDADIDVIVAQAREDLAVTYTDAPTASPTSNPTVAPTAVPTVSTYAPTAFPTSTPTVAPTAVPTSAPTPTIELECVVEGKNALFSTCVNLKDAVTVGCAKAFSTEDIQPYYDGLACGNANTEGSFALDTAVAVFDPIDAGTSFPDDGTNDVPIILGAGAGGLLMVCALVGLYYIKQEDTKALEVEGESQGIVATSTDKEKKKGTTEIDVHVDDCLPSSVV